MATDNYFLNIIDVLDKMTDKLNTIAEGLQKVMSSMDVCPPGTPAANEAPNDQRPRPHKNKTSKQANAKKGPYAKKEENAEKEKDAPPKRKRGGTFKTAMVDDIPIWLNAVTGNPVKVEGCSHGAVNVQRVWIQTQKHFLTSAPPSPESWTGGQKSLALRLLPLQRNSVG